MPSHTSDDLTSTEAALLQKLATHPEAVVTYEVLERVVWSAGGHVDRQQLQGYVHRLRKKIEPAPGAPFFIINARLVGYVLYPNGYRPPNIDEAVAGVARLTGYLGSGRRPRKLRTIAAAAEKTAAYG